MRTRIPSKSGHIALKGAHVRPSIARVALSPRNAILASLALVMFGLMAQGAAASVAVYNATAAPASPFGMLDRDYTVVPFPLGAATGTSVALSGGVLSVGPTSTTGYDFLGFSGSAAGFALDHTRTVQVSATLKLDAEMTITGKTNDRAGLGLAFTDDLNRYTEMYINAGGVFLNGVGRVRDGSAFVPGGGAMTSDYHTYMLQLNNEVVTVFFDGTPVLTGAMFIPPAGDLPTLTNSAAVGDITSNSNSTYDLKNFTIAVTPEPAGAAMAGVAALLVCTRRRRTGTRLIGAIKK
jgi:hypothetical protein